MDGDGVVPTVQVGVDERELERGVVAVVAEASSRRTDSVVAPGPSFAASWARSVATAVTVVRT